MAMRGEPIHLPRATKRVLAVYVVVAAIVLSLTFLVSRCDLLSTSLPGAPGGSACNVSMRIITPHWSLEYLGRDTTNIMVADFLDECAAALNVSVQKEYWTGYNSYFISGIHGVVNGHEGRYWQYYVNGQFSMVGCSQYILHDNDMVEWRFEQPHWEP